HVYAYIAGFPIAQSTASSGYPLPSGVSEPEMHIDLVIPMAHPLLAVRVLQNGAPLSSAIVQMTPSLRTDLFGHPSLDKPSPALDLDRLLNLDSQTGADGVARFTNMGPGIWNLHVASEDPISYPSFRKMAPFGSGAMDRQVTILPDGPPQMLTIKLPAPFAPLMFKPLGDLPEGVSLSGRMFSTPVASWDKGDEIRVEWGNDGLAKASLATGLHLLTVQVPEAWTQWRVGPDDEGSALIAMSPAMLRKSPPVIRMKRYGVNRVTVTVTDAAGKPMRGWVTLALYASNDRDSYSGSTDTRGCVVFDDLLPGTYSVTAATPGEEMLALGSDDDPLPPDSALRERSMFVSPLVTVTGDREIAVTMAQQPAGYVRGRIALPPSETLESSLGGFTSYTGAQYRIDDKTGELIGGPLPGRTASLSISLSRKRDGKFLFTRQKVDFVVRPGEVTRRLDPIPLGDPDDLIEAPVFGSIMQYDGVTPAWGAQAALLPPSIFVGAQHLEVNPLGRLRSTGSQFSLSWSNQSTDSQGSRTPLLAAWLPGVSGVVYAPYVKGKAVRLVLPPPITIRGRVTVAGKSISSLTSQFQIKAKFQGSDWSGTLCDVKAFAESDGSFMLLGLTPGAYKIQAARDGIWLSQSQMLVVRKGEEPNLKFDIPAAGAPVVLKFVDASDAPLTDQIVELRRPSGPLADALWPKSLTTDSAGMLRLEGLEAGRQTVIIPASFPSSKLQEISFDVPPAGAPDKEILLRVKR
ncbi:MAG: carboxypeptidase-like regulatory domain-containing protein, partial [Capsulimonas sp.]|uniref:carboxypeptidase-like regulatory domain-containing protein n=1 Tax=Capsulimonas sp. TaxID=2494211 RepID=UPI0032642D8A